MATAPTLPDKIGPYRITRRLGQGGMGIVFEGIQDDIERRVAIKLLKSEFARDPEVARRFFNEARAVNRIGHPGIVQVSEHGHHTDGSAYLVMELLSGQTLHDYQASLRAPLTVFETVHLSRQIAAALAAAHAAGIVHRDSDVEISDDDDGTAWLAEVLRKRRPRSRGGWIRRLVPRRLDAARESLASRAAVVADRLYTWCSDVATPPKGTQRPDRKPAKGFRSGGVVAGRLAARAR